MSSFRIFPFSDSPQLTSVIGRAQPANYIRRYVDGLGCKTVLVEEQYIDKFYMTDYSMHYSRAFENISKFCKRVHFFKSLEGEAIKEKLEGPENNLNEYYLGFTTVKPIIRGQASRIAPPGTCSGFDELLSIGRTVLNTYDEVSKSDNSVTKRHFIQIPNEVSLFGTRLSVDSTPFTAQDCAVGKCASAALWVAQFPVSWKYGTPLRSLYEITDLATTPHPARDGSRRFPSQGLSSKEMAFALSSDGLEPEVISPEEGESGFKIITETEGAQEGPLHPITTSIRTFVDANIPLIAGTAHERDHGPPVLHAVTITGYSESDGKIDKIYVHDDSVGPYARVRIGDNPLVWEYEKGDFDDTILAHLRFLMIPQYHKIRYPLPDMMNDALRIGQLNGEDPHLMLREVNEYKEELLHFDSLNVSESPRGKLEILSKSLPRFLWVLRYKGGQTIDLIIDATSHRGDPLLELFISNSQNENS